MQKYGDYIISWMSMGEQEKPAFFVCGEKTGLLTMYKYM